MELMALSWELAEEICSEAEEIGNLSSEGGFRAPGIENSDLQEMKIQSRELSWDLPWSRLSSRIFPFRTAPSGEANKKRFATKSRIQRDAQHGRYRRSVARRGASDAGSSMARRFWKIP